MKITGLDKLSDKKLLELYEAACTRYYLRRDREDCILCSRYHCGGDFDSGCPANIAKNHHVKRGYNHSLCECYIDREVKPLSIMNAIERHIERSTQ